MDGYIRVCPRYTCGSPATVDHELGLRVAAEERRAYERALSGAYGAQMKLDAERLGLAGIAVENIMAREVGARRKPGVRWYRDVLVGDIYSRNLFAKD